jgi:hypothetical protein
MHWVPLVGNAGNGVPVLLSIMSQSGNI